MDVQEFYSDSHLGNRFGVKGPMYGPKGHLGQDFNGMASGTSIPAWRAGRVVKRVTDGNLGNCLMVQTDLGYVTYCHMLTPAFFVPGDEIGIGSIVGRLGMTGKLATGVHLHTTLADSSTLGGQDVHDPLPWIRGSVTPASTDRTELQNTKEVPMFLIRNNAYGYFTVAPGYIICAMERDVLDGIEYRHPGTVLDVADADVPQFLETLGGLRKGDPIPRAGQVWKAGESSQIVNMYPQKS